MEQKKQKTSRVWTEPRTTLIWRVWDRKVAIQLPQSVRRLIDSYGNWQFITRRGNRDSLRSRHIRIDCPVEAHCWQP